MRATEAIAIGGGLIACAVAVLVTVSIFGRWSGLYAVQGDFDLVQIGTAVSIFSFLSLTQARRGNIMVDTFTGWLPPAVNRAIDALWDLLYAAMMALLGWCLIAGARETLANGTNSMVIGVPLGPVFAVCAALFFVVAATAVWTAFRLLKDRS